MTLARNDLAPWGWSKDRNMSERFQVFWRVILCKCICQLIIKVILWNAQCNEEDVTKCLKHAACHHTPCNQQKINYKLFANIRKYGRQNLKLYNFAAYRFILRDPLTDLIATIESVLAQSFKIVCFKMSVISGPKDREGMPSLDGNTQHMSSVKDNNAAKL
jgi:hypothetical protein